MTRTTTRTRGERGVAVIMTALCLIPLMTFAAFGVDLASWYSRSSYLQKAADAAALSGTVWMPNLTKSTQVACATLKENGIDGGDCGVADGSFEVTIERGSTVTSLRVIVTDPDAARYFSQVISSGQQRLTRSAEAEYNLPIPLGSPLNYFGGDAERTALPPVTTYTLNWPTNANSSARPPAVAQVGETQQAFGCNVGSLSAQGYGRWTSATAYSSSGFSGSTRCNYSVRFTLPGGSPTSVPPPDYTRRAPTNAPCNVFHGTTTNGRWETATTYNNTARYTSGTGNKQCTWAIALTSDLPNFYNGSNIPPGSVPVNRPCRVGYETSLGWWGPTSTSSWTSTGVVSGGIQGNGNRLCRWPTAITTTTTTPPNPIDASRSPGFWAAVEGPQTRAYQGDAYSTRCYTSSSCTSDQNAMYLQPANVDRGFWYVVKIPVGLSGTVNLNVFDATYIAGTTQQNAGDRSLDGGGNFPTQFQVWRQNNALDFTDRAPVFAGAPNTSNGSCNWSVGQDASFKAQWRNLCNLTVSPGELYLINVQTTGTTGGGVNGYALEAVAGGSHANSPQPALYAYASMGMQNNNFCEPIPCTPPPATFYLAEVGPQYAGRTLVMELWDSGDVAGGTAWMYPMMPATTSTNPGNPNLPKPVIPVPTADCSYTADANPNARISGTSGTEYLTAQPSDSGTQCGIQTSTGASLARFNGEWLRIRIDIPPDYTCTVGVNPETSGGSCWWGIRYVFGGSANDVTTWQARIEGNPVHLTQ